MSARRLAALCALAVAATVSSIGLRAVQEQPPRGRMGRRVHSGLHQTQVTLLSVRRASNRSPAALRVHRLGQRCLPVPRARAMETTRAVPAG